MKKFLFTALLAAGMNAYGQDTIRFTWIASEGEQKQFFVRVPLGRPFTIDWGNDSIETIVGNNTLQRLYSPPYTAGTYKVIVTESMTSYLDFYGTNSVTAIDLYGCTALKHLFCWDNDLESLNASGCTALERVECQDNKLEYLNLSGCIALEWLFCQNNNLTNLDVNGCTSLLWLECYNNNLTSLNVSGCTSLLGLLCENNNLTSLDISDCRELVSLGISYNQLNRLDISNNTKVGGVACSNNHLLLSDLYVVSSHIYSVYESSYPYLVPSCYLGMQRLIPKSIVAGDTIDFSAQTIFGNTLTVFIVEKDSMLAVENIDYSIKNGIIIFYDTGIYNVTMTNEAVRSYNFATNDTFPITEVIAEITVNPKEVGIVPITNYELEITSYEIYDIMGRKLYTSPNPSKRGRAVNLLYNSLVYNLLA